MNPIVGIDVASSKFVIVLEIRELACWLHATKVSKASNMPIIDAPRQFEWHFVEVFQSSREFTQAIDFIRPYVNRLISLAVCIAKGMLDATQAALARFWGRSRKSAQSVTRQ